MVKSASEIALIQKATDVSIEAHRAAWKAIRPGQFEYETAALMTAFFSPQVAAAAPTRPSLAGALLDQAPLLAQFAPHGFG